MAHTERFGLNQFGGSDGGDVSDEGYKFSLRDRETIDRVLAAFEGHRHTGGLAGVWAATTGYGAGARILPTDRNGHVYVAIVAGLSASGEPTWPTGSAATVADNEVTWQEGGSEQTTQLPDPVGTPTAVVADDDDADLPAGTDLFYRVGFVDAYGLETAASDEVTVTTPDPLPMPEPPAGTAVAGGDLEDGPYYYAVSFWQEAGNLQTELSDTTFCVCEVGNNTVTLDLPALASGADGWRIYRLGPNEADLVLLDTQLTADGTTYTDDGTTSVVEPLQFPPDENTTNSHNKVTITAPDLDGDELPTMVRRWRIYRTEESGDYPDQSLVHEVVETTEIGGTILISAWEDLGEPLLDGIPLDTSATLTPPGPAAVLLSTADPLADGTADPGASGAASREDHVHPTGGHSHTASAVTSTATGNVAATNVQAAIAELDSEKLALGTATPLIEGTGAVGSSALGARQDHVHPAGVGSATPLIEGTAAAGSSLVSARQDHRHPATNLELLTDVDLTSPTDGQVLTYDTGTSQWVNETPTGGGATDLDALTDVALTTPAADEVLTYTGTEWVNQALPAGVTDLDDLGDVTTGTPSDGDVLTWDTDHWESAAPSAAGAFVLPDATDVTISGPADGEVLTYDSGTSQWVNEVPTGGGATDLEGLSDVDLTSPAADEVLTFDGTEWVNQVLPAAGAFTLPDATDVVLTSPTDGQVLTYDSGTSKWVNETPAGGGGGLPSRATENYTTASLAPDAEETGTIDLALSYRLLKLETSRPARVRVYASAAYRTADAARPIGTDPTDDHGLMLEYITTAGLLEVVLSPQVDGSNFEASPSAAIPLAITNLDASTGTVALDLTYLAQEA